MYNIDGATIRAKYGGLYELLDMIGPYCKVVTNVQGKPKDPLTISHSNFHHFTASELRVQTIAALPLQALPEMR